ncbi:RNA polymerase sigma factor [Halalkalibacillus halophilus]|uniref:RNA polymerase sigma factor n=1 Tax=Halalkalibacillus halophilus TaxID=392827 RepID=UPI000429B81A|nr:sigma-70 family RNA polymerase sigma factor [Halalkalibacillus halophilus]
MSERDVEFYRRIQNHDQDALEALYDKYERLLYSFVFKMTKQSELSEEVIQEVFMKIWHRKGIYDESKGKFSSWLLTVARNTAVDLMRKKKDTPYSLEERDSVHQQGPSSEDLLEWKEEGERVREAVATLKEDQQEVIHLFYFNGLSQQKIADRLDIPLGTVKGRIRLALKHLKKNISQHDEGGI